MERKNNNADVAGVVVEKTTYSHSCKGEKFYRTVIESARLSGTIDKIPMVFSEKLAKAEEIVPGINISVYGEFRSRNKTCRDGKHRLFLFLFAEEIDLENGGEYNKVFLDGFICKKPVFRETPGGRRVADILLAVNRPVNKSSYIPCICWGRNAVYASYMEPGDNLQIIGRIQSRKYIKKFEDGKSYERTAYEVSISDMKFVEEVNTSNEENSDIKEHET